MRKAMAWLLCVLLVLVAVKPTACATPKKCPITGEAPPAVVTFMASKTNPAMEGWVVQPSCGVEILTVWESGTYTSLDFSYKGIERVVSVPSAVSNAMYSSGNPLSRGANFSAATKLLRLDITYASAQVADNLVLPASLLSLGLRSSPVSSIDKVKLPGGLQDLSLQYSSIQSIDRVIFPKSLQSLSLEGSSLTSIDKAQFPANLTTLLVSGAGITTIDKASFPETLQTLELTTTSLKSIDNVEFPPYLYSLTIQSEQLTSLKRAKFPPRLRILNVWTNLSYIDFAIPDQLTSLYMANYKKRLETLERISLPSMLTYFEFYLSDTAVVRDIRWPRSILGISQATYNNFEIRQSDLPIFQKMKFAHAYPPEEEPKPNCTDPTAILTMVNQDTRWWMCVISDDRFETLYGDPNAIPPSTSGPEAADDDDDETSPSEAPSGSIEDSGSGSAAPIDGETIAIPGSSKTTRKPRANSKTNGSLESSTSSSQSSATTDSSKNPQSTRRSDATRAGTQSGTTSNGPSTSETTEVIHVKTPLGKTMIIAAAVAGAVLFMMLTACAFRACASSTSRGDASKADYESLQTPNTSTNQFPSSEQDSSHLGAPTLTPNDVRTDKLLLPFHLKQEHLVLKTQITKLGASAVYHGSYCGQGVTIKRIQSTHSSDQRTMNAFMDEIRMCAGLAHPKIVSFVGIAWSNQHDLAAVVELMAGGDLETLLHSQPQPSEPVDWSEPWTKSQIKNKTSIALDVAEALAYLHAFKTPILHRDLRARSVMLDEHGNAKLDVFAINRDNSVDETMRGEMGSAAWVAPEVLLGNEHSDKADIYAFGVLLVELDRCRSPYSAEGSASNGDDDFQRVAVNKIATKNIQVAVQVSAGELRPRVSSHCPAQVAALVSKCTSFISADRPSANEVYEALRKIRGAQ